MELIIRNIEDLRGEITRLKEMEREQSAALGQRFKSPGAIFSTISSLFFGNGSGEGKAASFFNQDIVGLISRLVLPFTLNKTVFRNSGFIVKTLVSIVSQRASRFITEDGVISLWDKAKGLFDKYKPHLESGKHKHKGAAPLSETN
jgi:hypothetical protein